MLILMFLKICLTSSDYKKEDIEISSTNFGGISNNELTHFFSKICTKNLKNGKSECFIKVKKECKDITNPNVNIFKISKCKTEIYTGNNKTFTATHCEYNLNPRIEKENSTINTPK